jgi:hypothetical protein
VAIPYAAHRWLSLLRRRAPNPTPPNDQGFASKISRAMFAAVIAAGQPA